MGKLIGFIGAGNMGSAIIGGILKAGIVQPDEVAVADKNAACVQKLQEQYGIVAAKDNQEVAGSADLLFLAVKPAVLYTVIDEIKEMVKEGAVVVSIAAGQPLRKLEQAFGKKLPLVRVMPNTPALVGAAMSALSPNETAQENRAMLEFLLAVFESFGKAEIVPEGLMDAVTGVSGSAPAYVFMFIEAMADAAVLGGMPRKQAYTFAAQAVLGSAKMVLETGMHPGELKDMVCSPAGTTIEAVKALEDAGFRSSVMNAVGACIEKSKAM
ncbi:MAG TPA: pyrroline-5-carboxylate reductase [Candidatus Avimonoglobus intestinipullorum]|uniref:Pyrroline-5-carboxylate reductase n=1 Tax=Candidatus Avimonoglobus intestinipullorum TaxID=2840699 RepID=A0A9D1S5S8_9FIRM|nr:pyrroline-5-carboxylate reductase [Candidatus Avimonoglobus intestinipullorum]